MGETDVDGSVASVVAGGEPAHDETGAYWRASTRAAMNCSAFSVMAA